MTHHLFSGRWKEAVEQMRACGNLKDVLLDDIRGGWEPGRVVYRDYYGRVRNFFYNGGANPFSQYELDRYDADRAANFPKTWTWDPASDDKSAEIFNELHA